MRSWLIASLACLGSTAVAMPAAAQPAGSPRDTASATVAGAQVSVDYGRPYKRGREIMGDLVPFGQVWRTGANRATHLTTDKSLMFGELMVPAGTYTVYTIPEKERWTLIINRQTGQWGTSYDPGQDLGRVSMTVQELPSVMDQFTISIEPREGGGVLRFAWDRTEASVPFMVH